jgi:(p)ppGpp synthase/HD superfamily hydrolase
VIAAGVLHDVLEKAQVDSSELSTRFGTRIAGLVGAVSEDQAIAGYRRRKAALRYQAAAAGPEALMVFAADKLSKVRELRAAVLTAQRRHEQIDPSLVPPRRLAHFRDCLRMLDERLGESPLVELLRTELVALNRELKTFAVISRAA